MRPSNPASVESSYDDIIVRSGVAENIVAERFPREGRRCVVLEAGRHFRIEKFPLPPLEFA